MKKKLALIIIYLAIHFNALGDVGRSYCMEAVITLKNGVIHRGYFGVNAYFYIEKQGDNYKYSTFNGSMFLRTSPLSNSKRLNILETDYHFHNCVRKLFMYDTVRLYSNISMIYPDTLASNEASGIAAYLGKPEKIFSGDIEDVIIPYVYFCTSTGYFETKFELVDSLWLNNKIAHVEKFVLTKPGLCEYNAYHLKVKNFESKKLILELTKLYDALNELYTTPTSDYSRKSDIIYKKINEVIEKLKKEKVIIVSFCSC